MSRGSLRLAMLLASLYPASVHADPQAPHFGHSTAPHSGQQLLLASSETPLFGNGGNSPWRALDTLELFGGLEGSKQPQDFGVNAHFGGRLHANWGASIWEKLGLGVQIGTGENITDHAVRVTSQIDGSGSRTQNFTTVGLFQRSDAGWTWGVVHDFLYERDYDTFKLSQWRGRVGYDITDTDQVGVNGMAPQTRDWGEWAAIPVRLSTIGQANVYWRHTWESAAQTGFWIGAADGHGRVNVALGDAKPSNTVVVFGSDLHIPLNDSWALFGEANFISPVDTGTVDAYLGMAYYPGKTARGFRQRRFAPVLPVANNTSFSTDLSR